MTPLRVAAVTNCVPHYRKRFWERVHERGTLEVTIYCQTEWPASGLRLVHDEIPQEVVPLQVWGDGGRWGWQRLPLSLVSDDFDAFYWMGNARLISSLLWTTALATLGKPVVLVGQAHSAGSSPRGEAMRLRWWRRFKHLVVYTDDDAQYLRTKGFHGHYIRGLNNGLDQQRIDLATRMWPQGQLARFVEEQGLSDRKVTVSLGRIYDRQQLDLFVEALPELVKRHPTLLHLVIGDGPLWQPLQARVEQLGMADHVRWLGAIYEEEQLAPWLLSSRVLVHPGAIGLTLMHAFGYGLPVITHDNPERHNPEFAAFETGATGRLFREGDVGSLVECVSSLIEDPEGTRMMGDAALEKVQKHYNIEVMVDRFTEVVLAAHAAAS